MSVVFTVERIARKDHQCSRCGGTIKPGERYVSASWPPGGEMGYLGWSRIAEHLSFTACEYEMASDPSPDAPDGGGLSDWPPPLDADGRYLGEAERPS